MTQICLRCGNPATVRRYQEWLPEPPPKGSLGPVEELSACCHAKVEPNSRTLQRRISAQKEAK